MSNFLIEHGEYQGNAMLKLLRMEGDERPLQFGMGKAKQLLDSVGQIINFIESGSDDSATQDFRREGSKYPTELTREQAKLFIDRLDAVQEWVEQQGDKAPAAYSGVPSGKFGSIKVNKLKDASSALKGFAQITVAGVMNVKGFRIVEGRTGLFVSMPQRKKGNAGEGETSEYEDIAWPLSKEIRAELESLILEAFKAIT